MNPRVLNPKYYKDIFSLQHLVEEFDLEDAYEKEFGEDGGYPREGTMTITDREDFYDRMLKYVNLPSCEYSYFYIPSVDSNVWSFYRFKTEDLREHVMAVTVPVTTKEKK